MRPPRFLLALGAAAILAATAAHALAATATTCAVLGDRILGRTDTDTFTVSGARGETLRIVVEAAPGGPHRGKRVLVEHPGGRTARPRRTGGVVPLAIDTRLPADGQFPVRVRERRRSRPRRFTGAYCLTVRSGGAAAETLAATVGANDVEVPWVALAADRGSVLPPFEPMASGAWGGKIQPVLPLLGARVYAVVVTTRVRDTAGQRLEADTAFAALRGEPAPAAGGPVARYAADPEAAANPYPEARLVRADGTIRIPDRIAYRGLDPVAPALAGARADLRASADALERLRGFSPVSPIEIALSAPARLATVTPKSVLFFERTDGRLDLDGLLAEAERQGVRRRDVALAISFPTQDIESGHRAVRERLLALAASSPFGAILDDPDRADNLPIGVFGPGSPEYGSFLAQNPQVAKVVVGLLPAREFRGAERLFDPDRLAGTAEPPIVPLDFVLTLPATGAAPYPVVIFQHGFGGSNAQVLSRVAGVLAERGIATIGITAASHGRRGSPIDLLTGSAFQLRDIFRQTNADQMALVRTIEAGVDVDGDGRADLDADRIGYLGISLGGLTGGPFVATEERIRAAVLNVMSGRTAVNGLNEDTRPIFEAFLAQRVGLAPTSPEFAAYLAQEIDLGQHAANEADSLNFARRWRQQPFPGYTPRRILVQEGVGDRMVLNVLTEELARVAGFATNTPAMDPAGVSGHWIFQPPGGHGIFDQRAEVRAQAATFLASGGTELADPGVP